MWHIAASCRITPLASILQNVLQFSREWKKAPPEDNVNSPAESLQNMLCIQPIRSQTTIGNIENDVLHALTAYGSATLSLELVTFLRYVEENGHKISQELAASIDQLQELFLGAVHQSFQLAGVTVDSRMIISLNRQGKLHIETASAEQEQLKELLSFSKVLPALLKLISIQSALLDGVANLQLVIETQASGDREKLSQLHQSRRVCLKGQLSHFYNT